MENGTEKSKYRPPYISKKGKLVKFTLAKKFDLRMSEEMQKRGLSVHGTGKAIVEEYLDNPYYPKYIELMKKYKQFEIELLGIDKK